MASCKKKWNVCCIIINHKWNDIQGIDLVRNAIKKLNFESFIQLLRLINTFFTSHRS